MKHSQGFHVVRNDDGSYTWTSRFGVVSTKPAPEYPLAEWSEGSMLTVCRHHDPEATEADAAAASPGSGSVMEERFAAFIAEAA